MHFALFAPVAFAAGRKTDRRAARAFGNPLHIGADFHNIAAEFVPENRAVVAVLFINMQIGAAHAAGIDLDDDAVRRADGIRDGFGSDIFCAMQ